MPYIHIIGYEYLMLRIKIRNVNKDNHPRIQANLLKIFPIVTSDQCGLLVEPHWPV